MVPSWYIAVLRVPGGIGRGTAGFRRHHFDASRASGEDVSDVAGFPTGVYSNGKGKGNTLVSGKSIVFKTND